MNHPTPQEIRSEIHKALGEDYDLHPITGDMPFIPVRVHRIVDEAITRACDAKSETKTTETAA